MSEQTTYDAVGQVTLRTFANIIRTTYTYDSVGNTESIRDFQGFGKTFTYDNNNRLTRQQTTGGTGIGYTYTYDSVGNRTYSTEWDSPSTTTYDLAGRAVTMLYAAKMTTYTYDANGNLTEIHGFEPPNGTVGIRTTMTYDNENRMIVLNHNGTRSTYTYDGDGLKRAEISASGRTTLVWDGVEYLQERS
jgi:YD repeat-containing protein